MEDQELAEEDLTEELPLSTPETAGLIPQYQGLLYMCWVFLHTFG